MFHQYTGQVKPHLRHFGGGFLPFMVDLMKTTLEWHVFTECMTFYSFWKECYLLEGFAHVQFVFSEVVAEILQEALLGGQFDSKPHEAETQQCTLSSLPSSQH